MSKSQKRASVSPFILGPLAGAALGAGVSFIANPQLKDTATKENVRRLLRSLILGGGVGLGAVTAINGGNRILKELAGENKYDPPKGQKLVSASFHKKGSSKLLAKLVKKAAGTGYWSSPNSNYAIGAGTGLFSSMLLYHLLNDEKKRNLGGYLSSGLLGLGAGLTGAGAYNQSTYGKLWDSPETKTTKTKEENTKQEPTPANKPINEPPKLQSDSVNTSALVESTATNTVPNNLVSTPTDTGIDSTYDYDNFVSKEKPSILDRSEIANVIPPASYSFPLPPLSYQNVLDQLSATQLEKPQPVVDIGDQRAPGTKLREKAINSLLTLPGYLGTTGVTGLLGLGAGVGQAAYRNRIGKGTPQDLQARQQRREKFERKNTLKNYGAASHPVGRRIAKGVASLVPGLNIWPSKGWGDQLGNWMFSGDVLDSGDMAKYTLEVGDFNKRNNPKVPVTERRGYSPLRNGKTLSPQKLNNLVELDQAVQKLENMNPESNPKVNKLLKRLIPQVNKAWSGFRFEEMPEPARNRLLAKLLNDVNAENGTNFTPNDFKDYTYQRSRGNRLLKRLIALHEKMIDPNTPWFTNADTLAEAEALKDSLPESQRKVIERQKFINSNAGKNIPNWNSLVDAFNRNPGSDAPYNDIETAVNMHDASEYSKLYRNTIDSNKLVKDPTGITATPDLITKTTVLRNAQSELEAAKLARQTMTPGLSYPTDMKALDNYILQLEANVNTAQQAYDATIKGKKYSDFGIPNTDPLYNEAVPYETALREPFEQLVRDLNSGKPLAPEQLPENLRGRLSTGLQTKFDKQTELRNKYINQKLNELTTGLDADILQAHSEGKISDLEDIKSKLRRKLVRQIAAENPILGKYLQGISPADFESYLNQNKSFKDLENLRNTLAEGALSAYERNAPIQEDPKVSQELRKNVRNQGDLFMNEAIEQVDKAFTALNDYKLRDDATDAGLEQREKAYRQAVDNLKQTYRNTRGSNVGGGLRLSDMIMGYHTGSDPYSVTGGADAAVDALNLHPRVEPVVNRTGEPTLFDIEKVKPVEEAGNTEKTPVRRKSFGELGAEQKAETDRWLQEQQKANTQGAPSSNTINWTPNFKQKIIDAVNKGADPTSSPEFNRTLNILEEKCKEKGLDPSVELNKILTEGGIPKERASAIVSARTAPAAKPSILSWLFGGSKDNKAKEAPKKAPSRSRTRFRPR